MEAGDRSCFDLNHPEDKGFWRLPSTDDLSSINLREVICSGFLYLEDLSESSRRFLSLRNNHLVVHSESTETCQAVASLSFQKMDIFLTEEGQRQAFGLQFQQGQFSTKLFAFDPKTILDWRDSLRPFTINSDFKKVYKVLDLLGKGAFSKVFRVKHRRSKKFFAAKFITHASIFEESLGPKVIRQEIEVHREAKHPSICSLVEVHEVDHMVILIMELVEGKSLYSLRDSIESLEEIKAIAWSLLSILSFLKFKGIIHRDIKPTNIIICSSVVKGKKILKLIDFGMACFLSKNLLLTRCGTPGYIAPEVLKPNYFEKFKIDFNSDVYSVGVILYELIYKRNPFGIDESIDSQYVLEQNASFNPDVDHINSQIVDPAISDLIKLMLTRSPEERPNAEDLLKHQAFHEGKMIWLTDFSLGTEESLDLKENSIYNFKVNKSKFQESENSLVTYQDQTLEFSRNETLFSMDEDLGKLNVPTEGMKLSSFEFKTEAAKKQSQWSPPSD